jgi:hypothetical protein
MNLFSRPSAGRLRFGVLATGVVGPLILFAALSTAQNQPPPGKGQLASQKFKNIKVFKNLPADQLIPIMHSWNDSLGVKCDFCHVIGANHTGFEKDDKPTKTTAREMVLMTMGINKRTKAVEGKVTCYMCHHGQAEPEGHGEAKKE